VASVVVDSAQETQALDQSRILRQMQQRVLFDLIKRLGVLALLASQMLCFAAEELVTSAKYQIGEVIPYILNFNNTSPRYILILFPGGSGVVNPSVVDGQLVYSAKGNFLMRARKWIVDDEFATVATNATSSEERVQAVIDDLNVHFPAAKLFLVGTSRGTEDTMRLASYLSNKIAGEIHTSSMRRIASFDPKKYANRHLVVHHRNDSCRVTPFSAAEYSHDHYGTDFIAMEGGTSMGDPCEAFAYHGYNGIEEATVNAIKQWIKRE
jgi:hypothetical protein